MSNKLEIEMHYFNDLKNMSLEDLLELRDEPRPSGVGDDELNLWIGRKTGNYLDKNPCISEIETTFMAYQSARQRDKDKEFFQF